MAGLFWVKMFGKVKNKLLGAGNPKPNGARPGTHWAWVVCLGHQSQPHAMPCHMPHCQPGQPVLPLGQLAGPVLPGLNHAIGWGKAWQEGGVCTKFGR